MYDMYDNINSTYQYLTRRILYAYQCTYLAIIHTSVWYRYRYSTDMKTSKTSYEYVSFVPSPPGKVCATPIVPLLNIRVSFNRISL